MVCGWARLAHFHSSMCVYHTQNLIGCLTAVGQRKTGMGRPGTTGGSTEGGLTEEGLTVHGWLVDDSDHGVFLIFKPQRAYQPEGVILVKKHIDYQPCSYQRLSRSVNTQAHLPHKNK